MLRNIEIAESIRENISPSGSGRITIFYVLPKNHKDWIQHILLVTLVGILSQAAVQSLKIFHRMLTVY